MAIPTTVTSKFHVVLMPTISPAGDVVGCKFLTCSVNSPTTIPGNAVCLRLELELPKTAFDPQTLKVSFKDTNPTAKQVVADLVRWEADLTK